MQQTSGPAVARAPFHLAVAPGQAVPHPGWQAARAAVLAALGRGEAAVLLGPPGTGKTLLLQDLAQTLRREGWSVRLVERGDALDPASEAGILLVDEAGRMDAEALARLCATDAPFVLAALPEFGGRLAGLPRRVTPVALEPLPPEEIARFVAARLAAAGRPRDMLEPDAVLALAEHSGGSPRLVNVLAGSAAFLAELERAPRVLRRHVDEAASLRDGVDGDAAPARLAGPAAPDGSATPGVEPLSAPQAPPAVRRRRRAALRAALAGLGLVLAVGWAASGWLGVQPPGNPGVGSMRDEAGDQPPPSEDRGRGAEAPAAERGNIQQEAEPPPLRPDEDARPRPAPGPSAPQRAMPPATPLVFRGPVFNETLNQGGQMSLAIRRQGTPGAVTARFEAWGGLLGSGELAGTLSEDGRISLSGRLMVGRNPFDCDLSGRISGGRLTGSASFVRSGGGRVSRSSFVLTGS